MKKENKMAKSKRPAPLHAGQVLRDEFMTPLGLRVNQLARDLGIPPMRISETINKRRGITADTALRLARYFNTSPEFWMGLQTSYELGVAMEEAGDSINRVQRRPEDAAA